jgi:short subunit dehydrogenase-like uncharacterized protein
MIAVYGATGYTGRLVCAELHRKKLPFLIAGRDETKLRALADAVGRPEFVVAPLDDSTALQRLAARGKVLLDCAGPFVRMGKPVQDAALAAGCHFLDITGEPAYIRETISRDAEARARGIALVNSVGFDVVPTDCAAVLAAEQAGAPVDRVRIAFTTRPMRFTQGTARSAVESTHLGSLAWDGGEWKREPVGHEVWEARFPDPFGAKTCVSLPLADVVTAPRSTGARQVRVFVPMSPALARLSRFTRRLFKLSPVRALAERWVQAQPEGPSDEERARSCFAVVAEAVGAKGTHRAIITGGNGYEFTAVSAVLCAELALRPGFDKKGTLTPTQAFGARPLLDGLNDVIRWHVEK